MSKFLRSLLASKRGATAVEYGLICSLVVLGMMIGLINLGHATSNMWNNVTSESLKVL